MSSQEGQSTELDNTNSTSGRLERVLDSLRTGRWFSAAGKPAGRGESEAALARYLQGRPGTDTKPVWATDWEEADRVVRQLDDSASLWDFDDQLRREALAQVDSAGRRDRLAEALNELSVIGYERVRPEIEDEELARIASGACLWTASEALTWAAAEDLMDGGDNPFLPKLRVFEFGHWPIGFDSRGYVIL